MRCRLGALVDMAVFEGMRHDGALAKMDDHAFNAVVHRSSHISIFKHKSGSLGFLIDIRSSMMT